MLQKSRKRALLSCKCFNARSYGRPSTFTYYNLENPAENAIATCVIQPQLRVTLITGALVAAIRKTFSSLSSFYVASSIESPGLYLGAADGDPSRKLVIKLWD
jgi:hypothetical protein